MNFLRTTLFASAAILTLASAAADTITLPNPDNLERVAWLDDAVSGKWGVSDNPDGEDIATGYPPGPWSMKGEVTTNGTNTWLSVNLTSGSWGGQNVTGTWSIHADFWNTFGNAVISMHIGQGNGDPDYFLWLITPGELTGTFGLTNHTGKGGGLSNMKLWGSGTPTNKVPDSGSTAMLLGIVLLTLGALARRHR